MSVCQFRTETIIVRIQDDMLKSLDSGKNAIIVLLYLSAAFNTVGHAILLDKLYTIGVRWRARNWVESYMSARTQAVVIGDATSQPVNFPCGVPQCSVLGLLLFILKER